MQVAIMVGTKAAMHFLPNQAVGSDTRGDERRSHRKPEREGIEQGGHRSGNTAMPCAGVSDNQRKPAGDKDLEADQGIDKALLLSEYQEVLRSDGPRFRGSHGVF